MNGSNHPSDSSDQVHVVVVNDDRTQLAILSGLLRKEGLEVHAFTGAEEALMNMQKGASPNLIVTDLHMPGIDGWRFCRLLRSQEYAAFNSTPILVVSATFSGEDPERITADLGANAFLPAPVDGPCFLEHVGSLLAGEISQKVTRVLIVEDSRTAATLLERSFNSHGYHIDIAKTGQEALQLFKNVSPEIVVLDYHLPDTNGDRLLNEFYRIDPRCAVIMITADPNPELALKMMKLGARAYVRKPFDPEYLITLCESARRELSLLHIETLLEERTRELEESEAKYRFLADKMNDVIWTTDLDFNVTYISPSVNKVLGFTPEECMRMAPREAITPESLTKVVDLLNAELKCDQEKGIDPERTVKFEMEDYHKNGSTVWVECVVSAIRDSTGKMIGLHGVSRDITERKLADEALYRSKERYRGILEDMEETYYEVDLEGKFTFFNSSIARTYGYSEDQIMGMSYKEYVDKENMKKVFSAFHHVYVTGETLKGVDWKLRNKDGKELFVEASVSLRRDSQGNPIGFKGITRDITERKQAADERLRREKLQGIVEVAGTICHEMNQPMQIISGNIDLMMLGTTGDDKNYSKLNLIKEQIQRVKAISKKLMMITEDYYKTIDYLGLSRIIDIGTIPNESE